MKKRLFSLVLIFLLTLMNTNLVFPCAQCIEDPYSQFVDDPYYENTSDTITGIVNQLKNLPASGNVNIDFLAEEILLHKIVVNTSAVVTGYVKNSEISNYTSDAIDGYSGQLREMRILLSDLLSNKDKIDKSNTDKEYMADAKAIIDTLSKELNSINPDDEVEIIYLKQNMATLKAANALAQNEVKYSKNKITSEISDNIIKFTTTDLSRLSTIEKAFS